MRERFRFRFFSQMSVIVFSLFLPFLPLFLSLVSFSPLFACYFILLMKERSNYFQTNFLFHSSQFLLLFFLPLSASPSRKPEEGEDREGDSHFLTWSKNTGGMPSRKRFPFHSGQLGPLLLPLSLFLLLLFLFPSLTLFLSSPKPDTGHFP